MHTFLYFESMKVVTTIEEMTSIITSLKSLNKTIGLVPTMGALHEGHISLLKKSIENNDLTITSIFVNPTQFDKKEDLINYPNTIESDLKTLQEMGSDFVFTPKAENIYNNSIVSEKFSFDGLENEMEGKHRDDHFNGVGTIVKKLFEITRPHNAYFGEKDFQQLQIIRKLVSKNKLSINIIGCEIFREKDGLAMSSRNMRLSKTQRKAAPFIYQTLQTAKSLFQTKSISETNKWLTNEFKNHPSLELEYFEIADEATLKTITSKKTNTKYRAFIAVFAGSIRLIDNIAL